MCICLIYIANNTKTTTGILLTNDPYPQQSHRRGDLGLCHVRAEPEIKRRANTVFVYSAQPVISLQQI